MSVPQEKDTGNRNISSPSSKSTLFNSWKCCDHLKNVSSIRNQTADLEDVCPPTPTEQDCILASSNSTNQDSAICGYYNSSEFVQTKPHIINGKDATFGQIPWQAQLTSCGAVIINESIVVTAAHCIENDIIGRHVYAGHVSSAFSNDADGCTKQERKIVDVIVHPCYCDQYWPCDTNIVSTQNDIALLWVDKPFIFNKFVWANVQ